MPEVDYLEFEFEHNGLVTFDSNKSSPLTTRKATPTRSAMACCPGGRSSWKARWHPAAASIWTWTATTLENTFQITEPGEYFFTLGFFCRILAIHAARRAERRHLRADHPERAERRLRPRHAAHAQSVPVARCWPRRNEGHRLPVRVAIAGPDAPADLARRRILRHHSGPRACRSDDAATALGRPGAGWGGQFRAGREAEIRGRVSVRPDPGIRTQRGALEAGIRDHLLASLLRYAVGRTHGKAP